MHVDFCRAVVHATASLPKVATAQKESRRGDRIDQIATNCYQRSTSHLSADMVSRRSVNSSPPCIWCLDVSQVLPRMFSNNTWTSTGTVPLMMAPIITVMAKGRVLPRRERERAGHEQKAEGNIFTPSNRISRNKAMDRVRPACR